ncbi:hypothetical protein T265_01103 [Opisthorchis viverrini]|uniref:Uncharacterized protein n=1 Tax=Opisthorchis viverrini TaxID=6198 RepID=A0A074ZZY1_OPIVI|nr:hypothetical protein T265_01103 [Opisthorchis viverrini]KER33023.1 hypothetical protein T265_01103 [Opisthorchis viverrini]
MCAFCPKVHPTLEYYEYLQHSLQADQSNRTHGRPVLMRRNTRSSKYDPLIERSSTHMSDALTVSLRHLAPSADFGCAPASEQQQPESNADSFIKPELSDSASESEMSNSSEHPLVIQQQRTRPALTRVPSNVAVSRKLILRGRQLRYETDRQQSRVSRIVEEVRGPPNSVSTKRDLLLTIILQIDTSHWTDYTVRPTLHRIPHHRR